MWDMAWPIMLVVGSNCFYHVCAKSLPDGINAMASLCVTYLVGAAAAFVMYLFTGSGTTFSEELSKVNWSSIVLGFAIVGLEFGSISMYRNGWALNTGSLVCNIILAMALILLGYLLYQEVLTVHTLIGVVLCCVGLVFINY